MGRSLRQILQRALVAAVVLLASLALPGTRPAAAAPPAMHVHSFGGLPAFADVVASNKPGVSITPTSSGLGYWLTAADGGVFPFGDAGGFGSTGGIVLNKPIVGMAATSTDQGYWLVAADGGIFPFGDAVGHGTLGHITLNKPVVGMAATSTDDGFWLVAADGGIFPFGDALGIGSVPGTGAAVADVVGMGRSTGGAGYVVAARNGRVWAFGDASFLGSTTVGANRGIVGVATAGTGYWLAEADLPPPPPPLVGPPLPPGSGTGRRIVYCNLCHRVWLVEANGLASRSYLVSGRYATPRPGTYSVFSKSRYAGAGHDGITMEYMVRFAWGRTLAIGFHTIPRYADGTPLQSVSQLGTFRSAGCIRQSTPDAIALWNFAPIGTRVVVTA